MQSVISIVPYSEIYGNAFRELNEEWIRKYFTIEEMDRKTLDHPKENIIDKGGYIAVATIDEEPVGVCALIPCSYDGFDFELSKMGVSPKAQGKGVGKLLGLHIIEKAKSLGASTLFLESNRKLAPALSLYRKLGFEEMVPIASPYARSDIQMFLRL
ncbi:GNAT family N-acetyltransferase [Flagellimonas crocea]|uniref:GNAT family N-acetyltransferase n=1 Tax=Flagellimonas crocea TaxID=3067311 RepID=UPI00296E680A|nr:GNAT family N-acetyltransferase [Muricauda sp. DH64]